MELFSERMFYGNILKKFVGKSRNGTTIRYFNGIILKEDVLWKCLEDVCTAWIHARFVSSRLFVYTILPMRVIVRCRSLGPRILVSLEDAESLEIWSNAPNDDAMYLIHMKKMLVIVVFLAYGVSLVFVGTPVTYLRGAYAINLEKSS